MGAKCMYAKFKVHKENNYTLIHFALIHFARIHFTHIDFDILFKGTQCGFFPKMDLFSENIFFLKKAFLRKRFCSEYVIFPEIQICSEIWVLIREKCIKKFGLFSFLSINVRIFNKIMRIEKGKSN